MIPASTPDPASAADSVRAARRQAFVDAARDAFFARGYGETTMSSIAAKVGGSKTTLWSYFPSKEELFAAVVDDIVTQFSQALTVDLPPDGPVEATLRQFATAMMATVLSPPVIALHRVVTGEAQRFPELGATFYQRGPKRGKERLGAYIAVAMADGRLRKGDPILVAVPVGLLPRNPARDRGIRRGRSRTPRYRGGDRYVPARLGNGSTGSRLGQRLRMISAIA
jgi:TetR/AcrR family transcriptional repressor of mexJK operon